jgi:predicted site-specific integrase-resolvase
MTVKDVCKKCRVSRNSLYKHLRRGTIKGKRHPLTGEWMIPQSAVERLLKEMKADE